MPRCERAYLQRLRKKLERARIADQQEVALATVLPAKAQATSARDDGEVARLFRVIAASSRCLWTVAQRLGCSDEEMATIGRIIDTRRDYVGSPTVRLQDSMGRASC
jgi:hypothetical protein